MTDKFNLPPPLEQDELAFNELLASVEKEEREKEKEKREKEEEENEKNGGGYFQDLEDPESEYVSPTAMPVFELDGATGDWDVVPDPLRSETVPARRYFGRVVSIDLHPFINSVDLHAYLASTEAKVLMQRITTGFSLYWGFEAGRETARAWGQLDRDAAMAADVLRWSFEIRQFTDHPGLQSPYDRFQP